MENDTTRCNKRHRVSKASKATGGISASPAANSRDVDMIHLHK